MINNIQKEFICNRVKLTFDLFWENDGNISDKDLAKLVCLSGILTSSSTVGRDLTSKTLEELVGTTAINEIRIKRLENKELGHIKGGKNSVLRNDIIKDDEGKFQGSIKRHG